ncbi:MAG: class I SAM-dependent methyltransferase [Gammaproteobacteria bacterium]|nr:class I SAM-dependent methyltransferase [Gammaproteobacteria bacterium]
MKSRFADKVLLPVREQIYQLIEPGVSLVDVGCGTGDLLRRTSAKIKQGVGVDLDAAMIDFANHENRKLEIDNLEFVCDDATNVLANKFNVATSTLCLHEMNEVNARRVFSAMFNNCEKLLIADYAQANSFYAKLGIEFDEFLSGHYTNYRQYQKRGGIHFYANEIGATIEEIRPSKIDGLTIWVIKGAGAS